jgi:hypothetical protein
MDPETAAAKGLNPDPNCRITMSHKYAAWPAQGSNLDKFFEWAAMAQKFWDAAAKQIQHEARRMTEAYILTKKPKKPKKSSLKKGKQPPLAAPLTPEQIAAATQTLAEAKARLKLLCQSAEAARYMDYLCPDLPIEIKRDVLARFARCISAGIAKKEPGKGLPQPKEMRSICLPVRFNGSEKRVGEQWLCPPAYCKIGEPYNPPGHHGPRGVGPKAGPDSYRKYREMRKVGIRIKASHPYFELDVLFHRPLTQRPVAVSLIKEGNKWAVIFMTNDNLLSKDDGKTPVERKFAGLDWSWRQSPLNKGDAHDRGQKKDDLYVLSIGDENQRKGFYLEATHTRENRRTRRQKLGRSRDAVDLPPFVPNAEGRKEYQRQMDFKKDELKAVLGLPDNYGWTGIKKVSVDPNKINPELMEIAARVLAWYERALNQFRFMCKVETSRRDTEYRVIARQVVAWCRENRITDVGSPDDSFKDIAEELPDENSDWAEKNMKAVSARNRQIVAPGRLRQIIEWELKKAGIRLHRINPWKTAQRCACGVDTPSTEEYFNCCGCGKRHQRNDVQCRWMTILARECAGGDKHPLKCSHGDKDNPCHGLPGCDEAVEKIKLARKAKKADRSKNDLEDSTDERVA